ncbi:unnamed protein product [Tenebrio molitor]|nr:unnamed protein product [Tenebrio molitor]
MKKIQLHKDMNVLVKNRKSSLLVFRTLERINFGTLGC